MITWPNIGLYGNFEPCEPGILEAINNNMMKLDVLTQASVIDFVTELPDSPDFGDVYILEDSSYSYTGGPSDIMLWNGVSWITIIPQPGYLAFVESENEFFWYTGTEWIKFPNEPSDVVGPASSVNNTIVRFDGTTGKLIKGSNVVLDDTNNISNVTSIESITTKTQQLDVKESIQSLTGADQTITTPTSVVVKINSTVTSIAAITAPIISGYDRLHLFVNKTAGNLTFRNNANIVTGTGADISIIPGASILAVYDTVDTAWRVVSTLEKLVTTDAAQILTNKDIDGGVATNTRRITLPKESTTNLNALTRKQGNFFYDTTTDTVKYDNGSILIELATSTFVLPTVQRFTTGSGTYNRPVGVKYIKVRAVGGGGGGAGSGTAGQGSGANGSDTTFGTSLITASGGQGATSTRGAGGGFTVNGPAVNIASIVGGYGNGGGGFVASGAGVIVGGAGGSNPFGGSGGTSSGAVGQAGIDGTGGGGSGSSITTTAGANQTAGSGGGASGYVEAFIFTPSATYSYSIGTGGSGGTAGTSGGPGAKGGDGIIIVEEYYQ